MERHKLKINNAVTSIERELSCFVCKQVCVDPFELRCGHIFFCRKCKSTFEEGNSHCPRCSKYIATRGGIKRKSDYSVRNSISDENINTRKRVCYINDEEEREDLQSSSEESSSRSSSSSSSESSTESNESEEETSDIKSRKGIRVFSVIEEEGESEKESHSDNEENANENSDESHEPHEEITENVAKENSAEKSFNKKAKVSSKKDNSRGFEITGDGKESETEKNLHTDNRESVNENLNKSHEAEELVETNSVKNSHNRKKEIQFKINHASGSQINEDDKESETEKDSHKDNGKSVDNSLNEIHEAEEFFIPFEITEELIETYSDKNSHNGRKEVHFKIYHASGSEISENDKETETEEDSHNDNGESVNENLNESHESEEEITEELIETNSVKKSHNGRKEDHFKIYHARGSEINEDGEETETEEEESEENVIEAEDKIQEEDEMEEENGGATELTEIDQNQYDKEIVDESFDKSNLSNYNLEDELRKYEQQQVQLVNNKEKNDEPESSCIRNFINNNQEIKAKVPFIKCGKLFRKTNENLSDEVRPEFGKRKKRYFPSIGSLVTTQLLSNSLANCSQAEKERQNFSSHNDNINEATEQEIVQNLNTKTNSTLSSRLPIEIASSDRDVEKLRESVNSEVYVDVHRLYSSDENFICEEADKLSENNLLPNPSQRKSISDFSEMDEMSTQLRLKINEIEKTLFEEEQTENGGFDSETENLEEVRERGNNFAAETEEDPSSDQLETGKTQHSTLNQNEQPQHKESVSETFFMNSENVGKEKLKNISPEEEQSRNEGSGSEIENLDSETVSVDLETVNFVSETVNLDSKSVKLDSKTKNTNLEDVEKEETKNISPREEQLINEDLDTEIVNLDSETINVNLETLNLDSEIINLDSETENLDSKSLKLDSKTESTNLEDEEKEKTKNILGSEIVILDSETINLNLETVNSGSVDDEEVSVKIIFCSKIIHR